jgi:DNA-binding MarR family transcriptional regulator
MPGPRNEPLGLQLIGTGRLVGQEFDAALAAAGSSLGEWLALVALKGQRHGGQHDLAGAAGDEQTVLGDLQARGLVRLQRAVDGGAAAELTPEGQAAFNRLLKAVVAFDRRLRQGISEDDLTRLDVVLDRLRGNLSAASSGSAVAGRADSAPGHRRPDHH